MSERERVILSINDEVSAAFPRPIRPLEHGPETQGPAVGGASLAQAGQGQAAPENGEARPRMTRVVYSSREVMLRFEENLEALDLQNEIIDLGHGLNSFFKRDKSLREFTAVAVALWKLALDQSFPHEAEEFLRAFLLMSPVMGSGRQKKKLQERIQVYQHLLDVKKNTDFSPLALYLAEYLNLSYNDRKNVQFKLTLSLRRMYQTIFDLLI